MGLFWVDFPVGASVSLEVLLCSDCQSCGCQGNWHSRSVCRLRVPVPAPLCYISRDVFSWPLSLPCHGAEEGHGCSSPVAACEPASTARRGLCRLCCVHQLRHCCPRLCPSLIFWGPWRLQLVHRETPECAHWTSGTAVGTGKGTGCWVSFPMERSKPFHWSVCSQLFPVQISCTCSG